MQTYARRGVLPSRIRTFWRFGSKRRFVATMEWLRATPNVHLFGPVGQRELAATVQACDVGVIPHRDQECIRAMSPIKLYEYLAAGIPTVTVDLPPVHGIDDRVLPAPGPVTRALQESWAARAAEGIDP